MATLYAIQWGIDHSSWKEDGSGTIDMLDAMACSDDDGKTWRPFVNGEPIATGSVLKFFLYDLTEPQPSSKFNIVGRKGVIVFSRRASGVQQAWPMPWVIGGSSTWPGWPLTEVPLATEVPSGTSAPAWIGTAKQPRGVLKMSGTTHKDPWPPQRQVKLAREGRYLIGLAILYSGHHSTQYERERELVVGGNGQKASLEIRLRGGHPRPNGAAAVLSKAGRGRPDQVVFTAEDRGYTISLLANLWKEHPQGHSFDLERGKTSGVFQLLSTAAVGPQDGYAVRPFQQEGDERHHLEPREHPPHIIIDP